MLPILFRDDRFVVLDKPAGLPVHPGPGGGAAVEDVFPSLSRRKTGPWLAHRLDADTSGCLVVALRLAALHAAQGQFAAGRVEKVYWAITRGGPQGEHGIVSAPLLKQTQKSGWRMVVSEHGQEATTEWRVLGRSSEAAWLELRPRTGRTHQVRVHCAFLGCPILGDPIYDSGQDGSQKLHLLARSIDLHLEPPVTATANPSPAMAATMSRLGFNWPGQQATAAAPSVRIRQLP